MKEEIKTMILKIKTKIVMMIDQIENDDNSIEGEDIEENHDHDENSLEKKIKKNCFLMMNYRKKIKSH